LLFGVFSRLIWLVLFLEIRLSEGKIYEKDLGPKTAEIVAKMKEYNPDATWVQFYAPE